MRSAVAALLLLNASLSFAQSVEYTTDPEAINLTIDAGYDQGFDLTIGIKDHVEGSSPLYDIYFSDFLLEGDEIPSSWISTGRDSDWLFMGMFDTTTSRMTISPPSGTPGGIYEGMLFIKATHQFHSKTPIDLGSGIPVSITIPSTCTEEPILHVESDTTYLWPPNGKHHDILFSGSATTGDGCTLSDIEYIVEDEYGELNSSGTLTAAEDGLFVLSDTLIAHRHGQDKDGRLYSVMFTVSNENGTAETTLNIIVPHDQRNK